MGIDFFANRLDFKEKNRFYKKLFKYIPSLSEETKEFYFDCPGLAVSTVLLDNIGLYIENFSGVPYSSEENDILMRFGSVFQQTYTRFLDLQKAEEQAREAQIEAALERVRARTMAMHRSDELLDAAQILSKELINLEIPHFMSGFVLVDETSKKQEVWMGVPGQERQPRFYLPLKGDPVLLKRYESWKIADPIFHQQVSGKKLAKHMSYVSKHFESEAMVETGRQMPDPVIFYCGNFKEGYVHILSEVLLNANQELILSRFTSLFQQTYTRFLDLKKAEEQAREAQIEAALERVRGKAMGMHSSDDVGEATMTLFRELKNLGIETLRCGVLIIDKNKFMEVWAASAFNKNEVFNVTGKVDMTIHPLLEQLYEDWRSNKNIYTYELKGKDAEHYYSAIKNLPSYELPEVDSLPNRQISTGFLFEEGALFAFTKDYFTEEVSQIFQKFTNVFTLTYRRYRDLKQAESQAREAQIEVALERIRARALAMHSSDEILEVANVLRKQMGLLGQSELEVSAVHIYTDGAETFDSWWAFRPSGTSKGKIITGTSQFRIKTSDLAQQWIKRYQSDQREYTVYTTGKNLRDWQKELAFSAPEITKYWGDKLPKEQYCHFSDFSGGSLIMVSNQEPSEESKSLQKRAASVFNLAYKRFQDLQKAEDQAREAQIEAALERVRSAAMAMHSSDDLFSVAGVLHDQLGELEQKELESSIIHIYPESLPTFDAWYSYRSTDDESRQVMDRALIPWNACSWTRKVKTHYRSKQKAYMIQSREKMLLEWYKALETIAPAVLDYDDKGKVLVPAVLYYHFSKFSGGALLMVSNDPPTEEARDMQQRAAMVFDLAYRRFLDLQKAEEQAHESQIEAALERVRAKAMSMNSTGDLSKAISSVFVELKRLNIETLRTGLGIISEGKKNWGIYSTTKGDKNETIQLTGTISLSGHRVLDELYEAWKEDLNYRNTIKSYNLNWRYPMFLKIRFFTAIFFCSPRVGYMHGLKTSSVTGKFKYLKNSLQFWN